MPVVVLKVAHDGLLTMANVSLSPFASLAVGVKLYVLPTVTDFSGVPLIFGALFVVKLVVVEDFTVIVNAGSLVTSLPSLTLMTMLPVVPTLLLVGWPHTWPVVVLKPSHDGLPLTLKPRVLPSRSYALGRKLYVPPAVTELAGVPEIVGARLVELATAEMENAGNALFVPPSVT